jgi:hypothetical protein
MLNRLSRLAAALALALLVTGCALATRRPSVAELKYNPGRYQDRTVSIDGVVTSSWGVPLMPLRLYRVNDGTGEVTVVAQNGRVPTKGARVRVKGRVQDVATLGGQAVGLHIQQTGIHFDRY